ERNDAGHHKPNREQCGGDRTADEGAGQVHANNGTTSFSGQLLSGSGPVQKLHIVTGDCHTPAPAAANADLVCQDLQRQQIDMDLLWVYQRKSRVKCFASFASRKHGETICISENRHAGSVWRLLWSLDYV